jgi:muramoyltetrapeptide carboxypeptidase
VASLGTPYEIKTEGKILFLEDLGEEPYRLDRMLTQLDLAGKLAGVAGIVLGSFEGCEAAKGDCTAAEVLREILCRLEIPILAGFPAGHGPQNWAFPLGIKVRLDADTRQLAFLESAVI